MIHELKTVFKYALYNVLRGRWIFFYGLFFFVFASALLRFSGVSDKCVASLLNVVLLTIPFVSALFGSIYWYNSDSFILLLLTQPVRRSSVFIATWLAVSGALALSFVLSTALAVQMFSAFHANALLLLLLGSVLTFIFTALGMLVSTYNSDRLKGIGLTFLVLLYFAVLHDAVVFFLIASLKDYPIEIPSLLMMAANPVDLARVSLLLSLDLTAMMGYTGRWLQHLIAAPYSIAFALGVLSLWLILPPFLAVRKFRNKDL